MSTTDCEAVKRHGKIGAFSLEPKLLPNVHLGDAFCRVKFQIAGSFLRKIGTINLQWSTAGAFADYTESAIKRTTFRTVHRCVPITCSGDAFQYTLSELSVIGSVTCFQGSRSLLLLLFCFANSEIFLRVFFSFFFL